MIHIVDLTEARVFAGRYLCSDCWERLVVIYDKPAGAFLVRCATPGCDCHGYVSPRWVERREAVSAAELDEARRALAPFLPKPPKRAETSILADLGL